MLVFLFIFYFFRVFVAIIFILVFLILFFLYLVGMSMNQFVCMLGVFQSCTLFTGIDGKGFKP